MPGFNRTIRWLAAPAAALGLSVMVAMAQGTDDDQSRLESIISNFLSGTDSQVRLYGLRGIWSGSLRLDRLTVDDGEGRWLEISGVAVDWSPLSLFSRTFRAERIRADRIDFARAPVASETAEPSEGGFSLPVDLAIESIDLPEIVLGEGLAGSVSALSLEGSASAERNPLAIETQLAISRADDGEGSLQADIAYRPDENRLSLEIEGSEPQGGIVATLLRLPGQPPVSIQVTGSGPLNDWAGRGALSVDGDVVTRVDARHTVTDAGRHIAATGEGRLEGFVPEDFRSLVGGATAFDVAATLLDAGGYDIERAEIESGALFLSASGRYDPAGANDLSVSAAAKGEPVTVSTGAEGARTTVRFQSMEGRLRGEGGRPQIEARVNVPAVEAPGVSVAGIEGTISSPGFTLADMTGPVSANINMASLDVNNEAAEPLLAGPLNLRADATVGTDAIEIASARFAGSNATVDASGRVGRSDGTVAARVAADLAAAALPEGARVVLGERLALAANVERAADGALALDGIDLKSGDLAITGQAALKDETISADIDGTLADIARLSQQASGAIGFSLDASGPLSGPDVALNVTSDELISAGRSITNLRVDAKGKADLAAPAADLNISGTIEGQEISGSGHLSTTEGQRRIERLALAVGENRISGDLTLNDQFLPIGTLDLALPDLATLAALAAQQIEGSLNGTVRFAIDNDVPSVAVQAAIPRFTREAVIGEDISITADVENYVAAPSISGDIRAARVVSGTTAVETIGVKLTRDGEWTGFDGGATVSGIPAKARGRARYVDGVATVELAGADATFQGIETRIERPATIVYRDGAVRLDDLQANVGGGSVTVNGSAGEALALDVRLAQLPASLANSFSPGLGAEGAISGTATVSGAASDPAVDFDLDWNGAGMAQTRSAGIGALTLSADGRYGGGGVRFNAQASDGAGFNLGGGGTVNLSGGPSFDMKFDGQAPFALLDRMLGEQGLALNGAATIDVAVRGTASRPDITGSIRTSGARFVDARSGLAVNDLAIDIGLAGQTATIRTFTGGLSSGGALSATGTVGIDPAAGLPADISITAREARYADGRIVTANFSGDIKVTGPLMRQPLISGQVDLGRTVINIPERLPSSLSQIDVKHRNAPAPVRRQAEELKPATASGEGGGGIRLDLQIEAPQQIFVRGRGLDAEMGGSLRLTGLTSSPQAVGTFKLRRGRLGILGRRLDFTSGSVGFAGSLVPLLNFSATADAGDVAVVVGVTGPADDPAFAFSSTPTLPQDEVLAQLIFGRSLSNLSPLQIAQLAEAAAQLTGVGGGTGLFGALRDRLGVDDIDIRTDEKTGDTSVAVGKYINDRTYLSVEKGSSSESGKLRIDLDVGRGVKLRGEAATDGETKGGVFFEREY